MENYDRSTLDLEHIIRLELKEESPDPETLAE